MTTPVKTQALRTGDKAFYDSFAGLVPCVVESIQGRSGFASTAQTVKLRTTSDHRPYKRGEVIETNGIHAIPRWAVKQGEYSNRILAYAVDVDQETN